MVEAGATLQGGAAEVGGLTRPEDDAEEAGYTVTILVEGGVPDTGEAVRVASADGMVADVLLELDSSGEAQVELVAGSYLFARESPGGSIGTVVAAEVTKEMQVVLPAPQPFRLRVLVLDSDSEQPIDLADVHLERVDVPDRATWRPSPMGVKTGIDGRAAFDELQPARWGVTADAAGYGKEDYELDVSGTVLQQVVQDGELEFGPLYLVPEKEAVFELVGARPLYEPSGFEIAYTHDGERVRFSDEGLASVVLGRHSDPLYMKLWYPDGKDMILYVMGGAPTAEQPHRIRVGGEKSLDVRLELSRKIEELVGDRKAWVRVAFQDKGSEKQSVMLPVEGDGVYRCQGVYAEDVTVSFITMGESLPIDWQSQWVEMESSEVTATTLAVAQVPRTITFVRSNGEPASQVPFQGYSVPDLTGWTADGLTGEDGTASVSYVDDKEVVLFAHAANQTEILIEVPVDLRSLAADPVITMGGGEPTFVEATCEGRPVPGVWVDLHGRQTGVFYTSYMTSEQGRTKGISLHPQSDAEFSLYPCDYWTSQARWRLQQGRNVLPLWRKGWLTVSGVLGLGDVYSDEFGSDLESWQASGLIEVSAGEGGSLVCSVPVGTYWWMDASGERQDIDVSVDVEGLAR